MSKETKRKCNCEKLSIFFCVIKMQHFCGECFFDHQNSCKSCHPYWRDDPDFKEESI